jgi:multiple sugar transport system ATP-binding protein
VAGIQLQGVSKTWPDGRTALAQLDLDVADGELLVVVGPSGCGKSTLLRIVAGLASPTRGHVRIGERDVTRASPRERDLAMVFQSYALYPHMSVRDNLGFGLRMRGLPRSEIARRVEDAAVRLGLGELLDRRPAALSGGQRQRVALGRAIVREPAAFLLDEPLSNLDAKLRVETRAEIARLHRELAATMLYVTHDQEEAMTLGDRIAVLREGRIEQLGPPLDVYRRPSSAFVADFIGLPRINWFEGSLESGDAGLRIVGDGFALRAPEGLEAAVGTKVRLGVRPADLEPAPPHAADLTGRVELVEALGSACLVHARHASRTIFRVLAPGESAPAPGGAIAVSADRGRLHVFDDDSGRRIGA